MATLDINGYQVQVSDSFKSMSLVEQQKVLDWLLSHISPDDHPAAKNIGRSPVQWSVVQ